MIRPSGERRAVYGFFQLLTVFCRRDTVKFAERLDEAAVIGKAAGETGVQNIFACHKAVAELLHPKIRYVMTDALVGVALEAAGKMLSADIKPLRNVCHIELRISKVLENICRDPGDELA